MKKAFEKLNLRDYGVLLGFLALCIAISIATPSFLGKQNILNLLRQSSIIGIISAGMTFVIISGNFDISVGAVAALAGAITMKFATGGTNLFASMLLGVAICAVIGLINGIVVAKINVPSLIATMAMVTIVRGLLLMLTGGYPITENIPILDYIGNGYLFNIPIPVVIFFIVVLVSFIVLNKTKFGRYVYSVGGNQEASKLNGINLLMLTGGYPITENIPILDYIGNGYLFSIPIPVVIFFIVVLASFIVLNKTKFGRYVYSVGGNQEASKLNGINVDSHKVKVFIINAVLAGIAGIVLTGRLGTATAIAGEGYDMDAIASVVIGGTSVAGGSGSVLK
ncbi:ABC transporter permease, partial [Clostridioides difficile]|nr:ABC transporter permease [Clostridioides difficile]